MKIKYLLLLVPVSAVLCSRALVSPAAAQSSLPSCVSAATDSDSDGFGFENGRSCIVDATTITTTSETGQCEDRGGFPWGWKPATLTSCRLDQQSTGGETPSGAGACLDPDGDGFGWNGVATCIIGGTAEPETNALEDLFLGTWVCQSQYAGLVNGYEPDLSSGLIGALGAQMSWISFEVPSQGSPIPVTSDRQLLTLNDDKTAELSDWIYDSLPRTTPFIELSDDWPQAGTWSEANSGTWTVEQLRLMLSVTGENGRYSLANSIQFDSTDGSDPAIYFYSDITTRVACLQQ